MNLREVAQHEQRTQHAQHGKQTDTCSLKRLPRPEHSTILRQGLGAGQTRQTDLSLVGKPGKDFT